MRSKKFITYFFIFFFFVVSTLAVPPFQSSSEQNELTIVYPKFEFLKRNIIYNLYFHVVNGTGKILNVSMVDCSFHLFNTSNDHILIIDEMVSNGNDFDLEVELGYNATDKIGIYGYNMWCNSSEGENGFLSTVYEVTENGFDDDSVGSNLLVLIALIPLIFGLFMIVGAATLGSDHDVLRIFLFLLSPITVWVSFHFSMIGLVRYYGLWDLQEAVGNTTYWMTWLFFVLLSYFIIYSIWIWANVIAQKKKERIEY